MSDQHKQSTTSRQRTNAAGRISAKQIAWEFGVSENFVRIALRFLFPQHKWQDRWVLTAKQAQTARRFLARRLNNNGEQRQSRTDGGAP